MKQYRFKATIEEAGQGGACILFPYDVEKEFGTRGQVPVKVTFDGEPYTGTMVKYGRSRHMLPMSRPSARRSARAPATSSP